MAAANEVVFKQPSTDFDMKHHDCFNQVLEDKEKECLRLDNISKQTEPAYNQSSTSDGGYIANIKIAIPHN